MTYQKLFYNYIPSYSQYNINNKRLGQKVQSRSSSVTQAIIFSESRYSLQYPSWFTISFILSLNNNVIMLIYFQYYI